MKETSIEEGVLHPVVHTGKAFYAFVIVILALLTWFGYSWYLQLTQGLVVTGMRDIPGGSPWGIYLSNFIFFIGISHAGIAISAVVRLMKLEAYKPVARMAELVTVVSLPMAALSIVFDLGRPDRILHLFSFGRYQSPLLWDLSAITTYFLASAIYLYLSMRADMTECAEKVPKRKWLYKLLALGYTNTEEEKRKHEKALRWMAIAIVPIMVTVHTVVSWVFGLMVSRPGWYTALFGIYFVIGAIASGLAIVITIAWLFRKIYAWEKYIKDEVFRGLGWALSIILILYLYLWISEQITVMYAGPEDEVTISQALMFGRLAPLFWITVIVGFVFPAILLFIPMFKPEAFSVKRTVFASILVNVFLFIKRIIIVVPSLLYPRLYPPGQYMPTITEIAIMLGTFWIAIALYVGFVKMFPIMELEIERRQG